MKKFGALLLLLAPSLAFTAPYDGTSVAKTDTASAPTRVENVHGYTLAGDKLQQFSGLVFALGKVVAVGDTATLRGRYPTAAVIDGRGKTLLPGLIDAHGHVLDLGLQGMQVQLVGTTTLTQAQATISAFAKAHPDRPWVLGGGWNQVPWKIGRFPTAAELDAAVADRPAVLERVGWTREMAEFESIASRRHHPRHSRPDRWPHRTRP